MSAVSCTLPGGKLTPAIFNTRGEGPLPGHINKILTRAARGRFESYFDIRRYHHAPRGFLHTGSLVTLAASPCDYPAVANLGDGATGFPATELKSDFFAAALEGRADAGTAPVNLGSTPQVWDCELTRDKGRRVALLRRSQPVPRTKG